MIITILSEFVSITKSWVDPFIKPPENWKDKEEYHERKIINTFYFVAILIMIIVLVSMLIFLPSKSDPKRASFLLTSYIIIILALNKKYYELINLLVCLTNIILYYHSLHSGDLFSFFHFLFANMITIHVLIGNTKHLILNVVMFCFLFEYMGRERIVQFINDSTKEEILQAIYKTYTACLRISIPTAFMCILNRIAIRRTFQKLNRTRWELKKKNIELLAANERLEASLLSKNKFILSFSHELRNPLNGLAGSIQMILDDHDKQLPPKCQELIHKAEIHTHVLKGLITTILDCGKIEGGLLEINPSKANMPKFLEKTWGILQEIIKGKELEGIMMVSKEIPCNIVMDEERLFQVLFHMVSNAVKYTDEGSVRLRLFWKELKKIDASSQAISPGAQIYNTLEEFYDQKSRKTSFVREVAQLSPLKVDLSQLGKLYTIQNHQFFFAQEHPLRKNDAVEEGKLIIEVTDTGIGMTEEEQKNLFHKFSNQAVDDQANRSRRVLGMGLGLWMTKQIVESIGGNIAVQSRRGKGTTFTICIHSETHIAEPCQKLQQSHTKNALNALVVEDLKYNQEINRNMLLKCGCTVSHTALNGKEALEIYKSQPTNYFNLITMDIEMPVMDGKECCRRIRAYEKAKRLRPCKIIIISGKSTKEEKSECLDKDGEIQADLFIAKPASFQSLQKGIESLFKHCV